MENRITKIMQSLPGFRFHPTDEELLIDHLKPKIHGLLYGEHYHRLIPEVDVCQYEPSLLPGKFNELSLCKSKNGRDLIFFCPVKRKYLKSQRSDRTADTGYWKVTGKERCIWSDKTGELIGKKKTLVFYQGRVPRGKRTDWVMHEYHLNPTCLGDNDTGDLLPYVVCRVKNKSDNKGNNNKKKGNTSANQDDYANSSSPLTSTSVSHQGEAADPGDYSSFCNIPNVSSENDQADDCAQPQPGEVSVGELVASPPQLQPLEPYAGMEHGLFLFDYSYSGGNYESDPGYMPSPCDGDESYMDFIDWALCDDQFFSNML